MPIHHLHFLFWDIRTWTLVGQGPFLILVAVLYWAGRGRGWPWRSAVLVTGAFVAGLSVGTAFLPSVLGATAGGIAVWFLAQKVLGLRRPPLATLGLGLVALISIGRWGCLLNGCCFGTITDLPWAVHYGPGSFATFLHDSLGLLPPDAPQSLGVHPYPLYESLGLLCWLPIGCWLARRLRSEGAVLALCAAFDLALRGWIDGTRAQINVWWAVLLQGHGLNLFQWVLFAGAGLAGLTGWLLERRARASDPARVLSPAAVESTPTLRWSVFLGLCLLGWLSNSHQTLFLHRTLLAALAFCIPTLTLPGFLALRARPSIAHAFAGALLLALGLRLESGAWAEAPGPSGSLSLRARDRTWLYQVDQKRGVSLRLGNASTPPQTIQQRQQQLDLPPIPLANPPAPQPQRSGRTWVAGGFAGGESTYSKTTAHTTQSSSSDGCGGGSTTYSTRSTHRQAMAGWGQVEREIPSKKNTVVWLGGRAGVATENQRTDVDGSPVTDGSPNGTRRSYYTQLWADWEHPCGAIGLGVLGSFAAKQRADFHPGLHARICLGTPKLSLEGGYLDRNSFLGQQTGRIGASIAISRHGMIQDLDDVAARLFVGVHMFPGSYMDRIDFSPALGAEFLATPRLAFGFDVSSQLFGGLHLRSAF